MDRIINIIEAELKRKDEMIELQKWKIEDLTEQLKNAEEALQEYRRRSPFAEVIKKVKENENETV